MSSLKSALALAALCLAAAAAHAGEPKTPSHYLAEAWNRTYYFPFLDDLADVRRMEPSTPAERESCDRFYSRVMNRGEIKIVMGIGYYDFSEGEPFGFDYRDGFSMKHVDFGMNATIDNTYDILYRQVLTKKCHGDLQLCGFKEVSHGIYTKKVKTPEGRKIPATIEIRDSSVTPEHQMNIGPYRAEQDAKSAATTAWFFGNVNQADLVVYNGHSRKGGGPDFSPPKLLSNLHVDYDWYQRKTPGLNRLLTALQGSPRPAAVLMMSCNSANLFARKVERTAPDVAFSGTNAVIPGDIPNRGAMAGMDSFLKFQCEAGFEREMNLKADLAQQIRAPKFH